LIDLVSLKLEPIICGDTNINYLGENYKKMQLESLLDTYNLAQIIYFPTRISSTSVSLIDVFLDRNVYKNVQVHSVINGLLDHDGQILILGNLQVMRQFDYVRVSRDINDENIECGIGGKTIIWLKSYLENRRQRVELFNMEHGRCCSGWETVKYGVPQGSILDPLSFLLHINDLPSVLNTDNKLLLLYADDTSIGYQY
jgi:hypothetical protein